jgi:hypothetical protein
MATNAKDLTIIVPNRPGQVAKVADAIAKAGINIDGFCGVATNGEGVLHVLTQDSAATRRAVEGAGLKCRDEREVVVLDAEDRPGVLANVFRQIADQEISLEFGYLATNNRLVLGAKDAAKVREALGGTTRATAR